MTVVLLDNLRESLCKLLLNLDEMENAGWPLDDLANEPGPDPADQPRDTSDG